MRIVLLVATMLHMGLGGTALACAGEQKGSTIFEDQFADDSGGWDLTGAAKVQPPSLVFQLDGGNPRGKTSLNQTFDASEGDYCVDVTLPANVPPDKGVAGGLAFWALDYGNMYVFQVSSRGRLGLWRLVNRQWSAVFTMTDLQLVKPSGTNNLHVVIKDGSIAMSVNGKEVKKVRAQTPAGTVRFGLRAETVEPMPGTLDVKFQNFKLTSGS